jgi:hypothetical protein
MMKAKDRQSEPSAAELRALAEELARIQSTLTLATGLNEEAWAAPVYYVYHESGFYFFSDPQSRHILQALDSGGAAASIHAPSFDWREINGLQMAGSVRIVTGKVEAMKVLAAYLGKFPFTKDFFTPGLSLDLAALESRFRVRLYSFVPSLTYYLDNKIRFGFREEVNLN